MTQTHDEELVERTHYGIIDPDYARVFTIARCLAWQEGYALMMHGSFTRDLDLVAVPWRDQAVTPPDHLVRRIQMAAGLEVVDGAKANEKPHGRQAWTLTFKEFGDPRFIDLSIFPPSDLITHKAKEEGKAELLKQMIKWREQQGYGVGFTQGVHLFATEQGLNIEKGEG